MSSAIVLPWPECSHAGTVSIGQSIVAGQLVWHSSYACSVCGRVEADDHGFPPDEIRERIMEDSGCWSVSIDASDVVVAAQVLAHALSLPLATALQKAKGFESVFNGSRTEAEWIAGLLGAATVSAQIVSGSRY